MVNIRTKTARIGRRGERFVFTTFRVVSDKIRPQKHHLAFVEFFTIRNGFSHRVAAVARGIHKRAQLTRNDAQGFSHCFRIQSRRCQNTRTVADALVLFGDKQGIHPRVAAVSFRATNNQLVLRFSPSSLCSATRTTITFVLTWSAMALSER